MAAHWFREIDFAIKKRKQQQGEHSYIWLKISEFWSRYSLIVRRGKTHGPPLRSRTPDSIPVETAPPARSLAPTIKTSVPSH